MLVGVFTRRLLDYCSISVGLHNNVWGVFAQIDSKRAAFLSGQDLHVQRQVCPVILGEGKTDGFFSQTLHIQYFFRKGGHVDITIDPKHQLKTKLFCCPGLYYFNQCTWKCVCFCPRKGFGRTGSQWLYRRRPNGP